MNIKLQIRWAALLLLGTILFAWTGCSSSSPSIAITLRPSSTQSIDQGQTLSIAAQIANDSTNSGVSWSLSGAGSLTGSTTSGVTYNAPATVSSASTVTITATSIKNTAISTTLSVQVNSSPSVAGSATLTPGVVGSSYSATLSATGGVSPLSWTLASGSLPGGLTLSSNGAIAGTPTAPGTSSFTVKVTDSATPALSATSGTLSISITPQPLTIAAPTLSGAVVNKSYTSAAFTAGGGTGTITWSASGLPAGLSLSATTGTTTTITGTPSAAATYSSIVLTATDSGGSYQQTKSTAALSLTVAAQLSAYGAPTLNGELGMPFSLADVVTGGTPPYTWSLDTTSAALPSGLSLNASTGQITGNPSAITGSAQNIVLKVKDSASNSATVTTAVSIEAARGSVNNGMLKGQYAFRLEGFDASGNPAATIGTFTADGSGNITTGASDYNSTSLSAAKSAVAITGGSYAIGSDQRGKLTLISAGGTSVYAIALSQASGGISNSGSILLLDPTGSSLTGVFSLQTATSFSTTAFSGGYNFGASGFVGGSVAGNLTHTGVIGELQLSAGTVITGEFLSGDNSGGATPIVPTSGSYTVNGTTGRVAMSFVVPGSSGSTTVDLVFYIVSSGKFYLLSADPAGGSSAQDLLCGQGASQSISNGSYALSSLSGSAIFRDQKLLTTTGGTVNNYNSDVSVSRLVFDGAGNFTWTKDENAGGTLSSGTGSGTYTVASNGRVTLTGLTSNPQYFYLSGTGTGYSLNYGGGIRTGYMEAQTLTSYTTASLSGGYAISSMSPLVTDTGYQLLETTADGAGNISGMQDQTQQNNILLDSALSTTYTISSTGRLVIVTGASNNPVIYMVSASKGYMVDLSSGNPVMMMLLHQ